MTTTNLSVAVVDEESKDLSKFICVFKNETTSKGENFTKFHLNISGDFSVQYLYSYVAEKCAFKNGTFLMKYVNNLDEQIIDESCEDTLKDIVSTQEKRHNFALINKDENGPVTLILDTVNTRMNKVNEDIDVGSFFKSEEEKVSQISAASISFKSETGFVGLVNQAMTCYLNSLIQTLFMTPEFRNALYRWRYKGNQDNATKSIPYQLQKLFLKLETSKKRAVETKDLTKSFGWDTSEAWQQHDVQELCRVMFDALEENLKGTDEENLINGLYQGQMNDYVKCLVCNNESSRVDHFLDISLDVRPFGSTEPFNNLEESLKAFVTPDKLDGNNQYFCEKCNQKQDAYKGLKFTKFPYLLTIQFKRFTYDLETAQRIKLHDRLTFPNEFDISRFVGERPLEDTQNEEKKIEEVLEEKSINSNEVNGEIPHEEENLYELFSVLIHSGSAQGGHYYAYIKNFETNSWYCFNDMYVNQISQGELEKAYGGSDKYSTSFYSSSYSSSTSAYMVMYRRKDDQVNLSFNKQSKWSKSLINLCNVILQDEEDENAKRERQKHLCRIKLFCHQPDTTEKIEKKLEVHKDTSLKDTTEIAWKLCDLENKVALENCRLVKYDGINDSYERSFEGEEDTELQILLGGVRLNYGFDLLLECRKSGEILQVYEPGGCTLKVYAIDVLTEEFSEVLKFHIPLSYTVKELKDVLSTECGLDYDKLKIAVFKKYHDFQLLENLKKTLKQEGFHKSCEVFVEDSFEGDLNSDNFMESEFYKKLDIYQNAINLSVKLPHLENDNINSNKALIIRVDKRITLEALKKKISHIIDIDTDLFRVYRMYPNNQEYECTRLNESLLTHSEQLKIIIKLGRALKQGQYRAKLFQLNTQLEEYSKYLMDIVLWPTLTICQLKEEQIIRELKKDNQNLAIERIRLRKKSYKNPARIYPDNLEFDKEIILGTGNEYYVEILQEDDPVANDDFLSIYVRHWQPSLVELSQMHEIVLYQDTTAAALSSKIEDKYKIPSDSLRLAKGKGLFPCSVSLLDVDTQLDWYSSSQSKLGEYPFLVNDDGCVMYFKDSREVAKVLSQEERSNIRKSEQKHSPKYVTSIRNKEKALKIYTDGKNNR